MTPFCARILIFLCATLASGIKATPGSSANGCGLRGVAGAWRQHATQPQETQPWLEPKNQCVHFVVSFTFFPLLGKKKKLLWKSDLSPNPQGITWWTRSRAETRGRQSRGGWPPHVGRQAGRHVGVTSFSSSALQRETTHGTNNSHTTDDDNGLCCHQKEGKPRANFTVVFTTRWLQSCSGHVTVTPPTEQNPEGN